MNLMLTTYHVAAWHLSRHLNDDINIAFTAASSSFLLFYNAEM